MTTSIGSRSFRWRARSEGALLKIFTYIYTWHQSISCSKSARQQSYGESVVTVGCNRTGSIHNEISVPRGASEVVLFLQVYLND